MFFCEFCEISKNTFFTVHLQTTASALSVGISRLHNWIEIVVRTWLLAYDIFNEKLKGKQASMKSVFFRKEYYMVS